jgi:hypothetical protein
MIRTRIVPVMVVALGLIAACGKADSPTTPGGTGPVIREIDPSVILASAQVQSITVKGDNFATGLTLAITRPDGTSRTVSASEIEELTSNSFRTSMVFDVLGAYGFTVRSASGTNSPNFNLSVQATLGQPQLTSVSPSATPLNQSPQLLLFQGENLATPFSVNVTDPDGFSTLLGADAVSGATSTTFQISFTLNKRGAWSFSIRTNSGAASNSVIVSVG